MRGRCRSRRQRCRGNRRRGTLRRDRRNPRRCCRRHASRRSRRSTLRCRRSMSHRRRCRRRRLRRSRSARRRDKGPRRRTLLREGVTHRIRRCATSSRRCRDADGNHAAACRAASPYPAFRHFRRIDSINRRALRTTDVHYLSPLPVWPPLPSSNAGGRSSVRRSIEYTEP